MNVRALRTALQLTQPQFAMLLGVSAATVSRWEKPGAAAPEPLQRDLLLVLSQCCAKRDAAKLGDKLAQALALGGALRGLWVLLGVVYGDRKR